MHNEEQEELLHKRALFSINLLKTSVLREAALTTGNGGRVLSFPMPLVACVQVPTFTAALLALPSPLIGECWMIGAALGH